MNAPVRNRDQSLGAAPVGVIADLPDLELSAVLYLRLWCSGPEGQAGVWGDFAGALGARQGRQALRQFEDLVSEATRHARRPLMRHGLGCKCLGADEAAFAHLIAAAENDRETAFLIALHLFSPAAAPVIAGAAEQAALAIRQVLRHAGESARHRFDLTDPAEDLTDESQTSYHDSSRHPGFAGPGARRGKIRYH